MGNKQSAATDLLTQLGNEALKYHEKTKKGRRNVEEVVEEVVDEVDDALLRPKPSGKKLPGAQGVKLGHH